MIQWKVLAACALVMGAWTGLNAQISISSTDLIEGCGDALVDSAAARQPYGANEDEMVTLCPTAPDTTIWIEWSVFDLDAQSQITVHDGDDTFAPILAQGSGDQLQGLVQIASEMNPTGCLTIVFTSGLKARGTSPQASIVVSLALCPCRCQRGRPCAIPRVSRGGGAFDGADSYATGDADITMWYWDWNGDGRWTIPPTTDTPSMSTTSLAFTACN